MINLMKQNKTLLISLVFIVFLIVTFRLKATGKKDVTVINGLAFGTAYTLKIYRKPGNLDDEGIKKTVDRILNEIDRTMSVMIEESEVSRFNRFDSSEGFQVSENTARVVDEAIKISKLTAGAFDVTIAPLVAKWGFSKDKPVDSIPESQKISDLLVHTGYEKLFVNRFPPEIRKSDPDLQINLSGIAKGYAVDRISEWLVQSGAVNHLVEVGGEIKTSGSKPDDSPWMVAVERPETGQRSIHRIIPLPEAAIATSGDYRVFFEYQGKRYSHTIDPVTGWPVSHDLVSVSVITRSCMRSDALATAVMVLGPDKGYQFVENHNIAALLIIKKGDQFIERLSPALHQMTNQNRIAKLQI